MPLSLRYHLLGATLLVSSAARAAGPDATEARQPVPGTGEQRREEPATSAGGLVPLAQLQRRKYERTWFADLRVHDFSLGLSLLPIALSGEESVPANPAQGRQARTDTIRGSAFYGGVYAAYYVPLVGYSPNFSVGLLPELHAGIGALGDDFSPPGNLVSQADSELGTLLRAPLLLMARLGHNASRSGDWRFAVNLGFGPVFVRVDTGNPALGTVTYLAPGARLSIVFHAFELGLETEVAEHDDFSSASDPLRMSYLASALTLSLRMAP